MVQFSQSKGTSPEQEPTGVGTSRGTLEASLTGEKEVPGPGDPNGRGEADVKVYKAKVCYELEV